MSIEEKNQYIEQYIKNITKSNPNIFTKEIVQKAIDKYKNSEEPLESIIPKIMFEVDNFKKTSMEQKKYLRQMAEKYSGMTYQNINIADLDISKLSYSQMETLLFHYSWKKYLESYDKNGIKPAIGENSKGIDKEKSIFFSQGVEGVLELWDVWLKWRLNRQNNPQYNGTTDKEVNETIQRFKSGDITEEERKKWYYWIDYFKNRKFLENDHMLETLFEYQYNEMVNSIYLILDLKENEEYDLNQLDIKKLWVIENAKKTGKEIDPLTLLQYGPYSDFSSPLVDKWNMQTIPGKSIVIEPNRVKKLNVNGKTDVYSIMKFMYDKYKKEVPVEKQVKFDILDIYVDYVEKKKFNKETINFDSIQSNLTSISDKLNQSNNTQIGKSL